MANSVLLRHSDVTLFEYENLLQERLDNFLQGAMGYAPNNAPPSDSFVIAGSVPPQFNKMLERLLELYEECIEPMAALELIYLAEEAKEIDNLFIVQPTDFKTQNKTTNNFIFNTASYYTFHAVTQLNYMLPSLQSTGIDTVSINAILKLQQSVERASSAYMYDKILRQYATVITPEKLRKQASNGGKARAAKLYGNTKAYVTSRFKEIRSKNKTISMAQIAQKIAGELEESPIEGDEPLSNPYDTIYRWVRALNKVL